jgi:signal transduction histidine kinase
MAAQPEASGEDYHQRHESSREIQRAMLNILEDSAEEGQRLQSAQTATLNILEDFTEEKTKSAQVQTATLNILEDFTEEKTKLSQVQTATQNILEDFGEERNRFAQMQTATLNVLEDFDAEKSRLEQSQRAYLNILEDIDIEKDKVAIAYKRVETINSELQEFAYAASHDLKAPLRVIDNASKWLEEDLQEHLTDETRENMKLMRGRIGRMEKLLDDLLEYSRIGRVRDERFSEIVAGSALMENVLTLLSPKRQFTVTVSPAFADIHVARMPLQQILMNLVGNAIKHHDKPKGHIEISATDEGPFYRFAVKDDGPGIAPEFHEQIFRMFQTLKPRDQVEGSGMGLAMVRKNIEIFGGKLHLQSVVGQGSTFGFTWPKQQGPGGAGA